MRRRFVKGTITKTTGGSHTMYSNGNIVTNAGGFIRETADNQIIYGEPEDAPEPTAKKLINSILNGYFYTKEGVYLGRIGGGNNVYITDESSFLEVLKGNDVDDKIVRFTEKHGLNNEQLLDRANWIYAEGGYKISKFYAYTIENAFIDIKIANKKETKLYFYLMQDVSGRLEKNKYFSGGYENQTGKKFWNLRGTPDKFDSDMQSTICSVIVSKISPKDDPTGGTNSWLGYGSGCHVGEYYIESKGRRHFFMKYGVSKKTCVEKKI